jgi:thiol:disulfide interchange protein
MKKLARFIILSIIFVLTLLLFYSALPSIVWIFGGSFKAIAQHPIYVIIFSVLVLPFQGFLFSECFDENFYEKR